MPRIAGVDIPESKRIEIALTYIYGVGRHTANKILNKAEIEPTKHSKDLTEQEIAKIREIIDSNTIYIC